MRRTIEYWLVLLRLRLWIMFGVLMFDILGVGLTIEFLVDFGIC